MTKHGAVREPQSTTAEEGLHEEAGTRPKALVVDDDALIRTMMADGLGDLFQVVTAMDAESAGPLLDGTGFDLIVADQMLPDALGVDLLEASLQTHPSAVRVLITASRDIQTAMEAVNRAHVDRFFAKPVPIEDLKHQAAECVRSRRADRDVRARIGRLRRIESRVLPIRARVLVVDDDETIVTLFQDVLEEAGYDVISEMTGKGALDQLGSSEFNLLVVDKNLPDISGMDVLKIARKVQPDIEAVVVTGYASTDSAIQAVESGAYDYLRKPLDDLDILPRTARRAIERQALARERQRLLCELLNANDALTETNRELREAQSSLQKKMEEIVLFQDAAVIGLARLAEYRDVTTGHHLERMRGYARVIASELVGTPGFEILDKAFVEAIYKTAPLHDIGKVAVPDRILLKPGGLNAEEWRIMRSHPVVGGRTLEDAASTAGTDQPSGLLLVGRNIAHFHHERWDGGGYPSGMKGDEIPVEARIVTVADAYDAITSRRCYKPSVPHSRAREILVHEKGRHFDPRVVDAFIRRESEILELKARYAGDEVDMT